jgi:hypothetical protein
VREVRVVVLHAKERFPWSNNYNIEFILKWEFSIDFASSNNNAYCKAPQKDNSHPALLTFLFLILLTGEIAIQPVLNNN